MRQDDFEKLLSAKSSVPNSSGVFVPFKGPKWGLKRCPRIMICGKATYGYETRGNTPEAQAQIAWDFIYHKLVSTRQLDGGTRYSSAFWTFAYEIIASGLGWKLPVDNNRFDEAERQELVAHFYWTNLVKVGHEEKGNLATKDVIENSAIFVEVLLAEIMEHQPKLVVFTTGSYAWPIIQQVTHRPEADWIKVNDRFWHIDMPELKCRFAWTRHPQGWLKRERQATAIKLGKLL